MAEGGVMLGPIDPLTLLERCHPVNAASWGIQKTETEGGPMVLHALTVVLPRSPR